MGGVERPLGRFRRQNPSSTQLDMLAVKSPHELAGVLWKSGRQFPTCELERLERPPDFVRLLNDLRRSRTAGGSASAPGA